ncbi:MAG TPA: hypothetical protein VFQ96_06085, partial [Microbacteriaceae bacterium]|nr:hypothetical protein [Microbacteriaceae bacterium]
KSAGVSYAFAPVVGKNGVSKSTLGVNDWIWAFKTKANHEAADKAFLSFALSKENQMSLFTEYSMLPVVQSAGNEVKSENPQLKPFIDSLPTDTFYPVNQKTWPQVNSAFQQSIAGAVSSNPKATLSQLQQTALGQG